VPRTGCRRRRPYRSRCIWLGGWLTIRYPNPFLATICWQSRSSSLKQRLRRGRSFSVGRSTCGRSRSPSQRTKGAWVEELRRQAKLPGRRANAKDLETTIGRLSHAAYLVPNARPFLGRLYRASERAQECGSVRLSDSQVEDLKLWTAFVDAAAEGISINRLVFRWPSRIV
jgi:hypothetical protein